MPSTSASFPLASRTDTLAVFQLRCGQVIARSGRSVTAFAASIGVDRSTLSQLLSPRNRRLPRSETLYAIATQGNVSIDWLLGRRDDDGRAEVVEETIAFERDVRSADDERLIGWLREARDSKIRYIPATLPDILKTSEVIQFEMARWATSRPEQKIETAAARLAWQRRPEAEMECCSSLQSVDGFVRGEGVWRGLPASLRREQLEQMADRVDELYPAFRWFLYDGMERFGVPITIFGAKRAVIYDGSMYLVFNARDHVRGLAGHFDDLIRSARIQPPDVGAHLRKLRAVIH
jgi:transcriptional regulator with XRE-family HTH domain